MPYNIDNFFQDYQTRPLKALANNFFRFVHTPDYEQYPFRIKEKIQNVFYALIASLTIEVVILFIGFMVLHFTNTDIESSMPELPSYQMLVFGGLIVPLVEEAMLRLPMRYSPLNFSLSTGLLSAFFIFMTFDIEGIYSKQIIMFGFSSFIFLFVFILLKKDKELSQNAQKIFTEHPRAVIYFYTILFAGMHLGNYEISTGLLLFLPFFLLDKLFAGFILAYFRIRQGFWWAVMLHVIGNIVPILYGMHGY